ncbi:MAG: hypothetical protein V2A65_05880 [Candidatus Omnitrophota bacterium]
MEPIKFGLVTLAGEDFNFNLAKEIFTKSKEKLAKLEGRLISPEGIILNQRDLDSAIKRFKKEEVDCILIQTGTFPNGERVVNLVENFNLPFIVWALPEPKGDGNLLLNSFCGANMVTSLLYKLKKDYKFFYGSYKDDKILSVLGRFLKSVGVVKKLRSTKIGLVGYHVPGFYNLAFDELKLKREIGTEIRHIDLAEVRERMEEVSGREIEKRVKELKGVISRNAMKEKDLSTYGKMYCALNLLAERYHLDGLAIKCWPEAGKIFGMNPCVVISKLTDEGLPIGCEGDIYGTLTMLIQYFLTGRPPFLADLVSVDKNEDIGTFWHCGNAAISLARNPEEVSILHIPCSFGLGCNFGCKEGEVTLARLSEDTEYKMLLASGEAIPGKAIFTGTSTRVKFPRITSLVDAIIYQGFEHHFSLIHLNVVEEIENVCEMLKVKVVKV